MGDAKKILIFSTAYYPLVGGAEVAVKEITDRLPDIQFDLITAKINRGLPDFEKIGNVNVHRLGFGLGILDKFWLALFGASKALQLHGRNQYSVAWSMMASQASIAAAKFKIKCPEVKLVLTLQEGDEEEHLKRYVLGIDFLYKALIRPWHLLVFRVADLGTAISNYLVERMRRNGLQVPIELVPNGVDIENFSQVFSDQELVDLRERLGGNENIIILMSASRLVAKNGLDLVIRALPELEENIHFFNFGSGSEKGKLLDLAQKLGVSSRVHLEPFLDHNLLPKYLKIADIFIRPSRSEGQGISFLEAMAAKIPVIATPVGGIPDFLRDPSSVSGQVATGYFCKPENPESIAQTVLRVLNDPNKDKITDNAYKMVQEKYDWNNMAQEMKKIFF